MRWTTQLLVLGYLVFQVSGEHTGVKANESRDPARKVPSDKAAAMIGGSSSKAIDAAALEDFDKCRAAIDFTRLPIDDVEKALADCKQKANQQSAPLENPNFTDVKEQLQRQMKD